MKKGEINKPELAYKFRLAKGGKNGLFTIYRPGSVPSATTHRDLVAAPPEVEQAVLQWLDDERGQRRPAHLQQVLWRLDHGSSLLVAFFFLFN